MTVAIALAAIAAASPPPDGYTWQVQQFSVPGWYAAHLLDAKGMPLIGGGDLVHTDGRRLMVSSNPLIAEPKAVIWALREHPGVAVGTLQRLIAERTALRD